jgi:hypothetical protein
MSALTSPRPNRPRLGAKAAGGSRDQYPGTENSSVGAVFPRITTDPSASSGTAPPTAAAVTPSTTIERPVSFVYASSRAPRLTVSPMHVYVAR